MATPPAKPDNGATHPRNFKKAPLEKFIQTAQTLNVTFDKLSEMLGYGTTAHSGWRADNAFPAVAALACDALLQKHGKVGGGGVFVARPQDCAGGKALEAFCKAMNIQLIAV